MACAFGTLDRRVRASERRGDPTPAHHRPVTEKSRDLAPASVTVRAMALRRICVPVVMLAGCALAGPGARTRADANEEEQKDAPNGSNHPMPDAPPSSS